MSGQLNHKIVIAVVFIGGVTVVNHWLTGQGVTRVIIGSLVLLLVLSLVDLFGGVGASIAGALAMLAALYVGLTELPWTAIFQAVRG